MVSATDVERSDFKVENRGRVGGDLGDSLRCDSDMAASNFVESRHNRTNQWQKILDLIGLR